MRWFGSGDPTRAHARGVSPTILERLFFAGNLQFDKKIFFHENFLKGFKMYFKHIISSCK